MEKEHLAGEIRLPARRDVLKLTGALLSTALLDKLVPGRRLVIPEYVHARAGREIDILDLEGKEVGRFFPQAGDQVEKGYSIFDGPRGNFWSAFRRLGGAEVLGYPRSRVFEKDGFAYQLVQGALLQRNAEEGSPDGVVLGNGFDILAGIEAQNSNLAAALRADGIPAHKEGDFTPEQRLEWWNSQRYSDANGRAAAAALFRRYMTVGGREVSVRDAAGIYGYPTSEVEDFGLYSCIRCQRVSFQYWQLELPDHPELPRKGSVTLFLIGDILARPDVGWVPEGQYLIPSAFGQDLYESQPILNRTLTGEVRGEKGTTIEFYRVDGSPMQAIVQRPKELAIVVDKYLPGVRVEINFLPSITPEGLKGMRFDGFTVYLDGTLGGTTVVFRKAHIRTSDVFSIYFALDQSHGPKDSLVLVKNATLDQQRIVNGSLSSMIGTLIAGEGGERFASRVPQEVWELGGREGSIPAVRIEFP